MLAGGFLSGRKYSHPLTMTVYMVTNNYAHTNDAMYHTHNVMHGTINRFMRRTESCTA